jgi:hypothetical protein
MVPHAADESDCAFESVYETFGFAAMSCMVWSISET